MARSKKKKKRPKESQRTGRLALLLLCAIVALFAAYRWLGTPRGNVFLFEFGVSGRAAAVRKDLGERIIDGARSGGVPAGGISVSVPETDAGAAMIEGRVPSGRSLMQINAAVDAAVREGGGRIRSCVESRDGRLIEMEVGTRNAVTHRCVFRTERARTPLADTRGPDAPKIALVVDDFGYSKNGFVKEFLALEIPFTVSVIPERKYSRAVVEMAAEAGREVICHLPMEPERGADDDGEIPLVRTGMSRSQIERAVETALESVPGAIGMNNHMGSKATADRDVMAAVLAVCRRRGIFFLDSYTTPLTVVAEVGREMGVRTIPSDLFLDNRGEKVRENMRKMLAIAARHGEVTAIVHLREDNLPHLRWLAGEARKKGIRIVKLSEMLGD